MTQLLAINFFCLLFYILLKFLEPAFRHGLQTASVVNKGLTLQGSRLSGQKFSLVEIFFVVHFTIGMMAVPVTIFHSIPVFTLSGDYAVGMSADLSPVSIDDQLVAQTVPKTL